MTVEQGQTRMEYCKGAEKFTNFTVLQFAILDLSYSSNGLLPLLLSS